MSTPEVDIGQPSAASIGNDTITAGETSVVVETAAVTAGSKVFVTATTTTGGQAPYVVEKIAGESFTVRIDQAINTDISFDWWVVN